MKQDIEAPVMLVKKTDLRPNVRKVLGLYFPQIGRKHSPFYSCKQAHFYKPNYSKTMIICTTFHVKACNGW